MFARSVGLALGLLLLAGCSQAVQHTREWSNQPYSKLSATVGDTIVFQFSYGHDVQEVLAGVEWPASCMAPQGKSLGSSGPVTVTLDTPGKVTYICTVPGHCDMGQSLTIDVAPAATTTTTSVSPSPSSADTGPKTVDVPWKWNNGMPWVELNVGDSIKFDFTGGLHNVEQLTKPSTSWPDACTADSKLLSESGPFTLKMDKPGNYSFMCTWVNHCHGGGMHLDVTVKGAAGAAKASPPPANKGSKAKSPPPKKKAPSKKKGGSKKKTGRRMAA